MQMIGIIGGIGSGKSTAAKLFQQWGAAVINADALGHQVLLLPQVRDSIRERWGTAVLGNDSEIDRRKLAEVVFADGKRDSVKRDSVKGYREKEDEQTELAYLQSLTHPLIAEEVHRLRKEYEQNGTPLCLLDAPLLLESGWAPLVDLIVFVSASAEVRWERVKRRDWPETEWRRRESAQLPVEEKQCQADIVLDNSGTLEHLRGQVETLVRKVMP